MAILIKRSAVAGKVPAVSDLALGELGMNTYDGKIYMRKNQSGVDSIVDVSLSGVTFSNMQSTKITATGGQTSFSVTYTAPLVMCFVNGFKVPPSDYTATDGATVVFSTGAVAGAEYEFVTFSNFVLSNTITTAGGNVTGPLNVPTQAVDDNSTLVANTAWYMGQASSATPVNVNGSSAAVGTSLRWARADHTHLLTTAAINAALSAASSNVTINGTLNSGAFTSTGILTTSVAGQAIYATGANAGVELGSTSASNTPYIDFHSSGNNIDYDVRLLASGGNTSAGNGALTVTAAGGMTCTGNITAYSDERLKTNWTGFDIDFVSRLAKVKNGSYDRTDYFGRQVGVSAQSLREVMPEAVTVNEESGYLSVAYGQAAMAACVELAKQVEELKAELKALRDEFNRDKDDLK